MTQPPVWEPTDAPSTEEAAPETPAATTPAPSGDGADKETAKVETPTVAETPPAEGEDAKPKMPETRRPSKLDFIEARKAKQAARDAAIAKGEDPDAEDLGVAPEDAETVRKAVLAEFWDHFAEAQQMKLNAEIESYISSSKYASEYTPVERETFEAYVKHPAYAEVPMEVIEAHILKDKLIKYGARLEKEANAKAAATKSGATTTDGGDKQPIDWTNATQEQVEAAKNAMYYRS